jgi:hypothetical protein
MNLDKKYRDCNDNPCNILQMMEREPEWVANRFESLEFRVTELARAIKVASLAVEIASAWGVPSVQVDPPAEWNLEGGGEDKTDGWCSTSQLSNKLLEIANCGLAGKP